LARLETNDKNILDKIRAHIQTIPKINTPLIQPQEASEEYDAHEGEDIEAFADAVQHSQDSTESDEVTGMFESLYFSCEYYFLTDISNSILRFYY
jgi:hypothetical protein